MSSLSVGVAFLSSPIPSIGGRGKVRAAVVMEPLRPASPPTHTFAASGPEDEGRPKEIEAEAEVEETASSSRKKGSSESGKAKHFDFLKVCMCVDFQVYGDMKDGFSTLMQFCF